MARRVLLATLILLLTVYPVRPLPRHRLKRPGNLNFRTQSPAIYLKPNGHSILRLIASVLKSRMKYNTAEKFKKPVKRSKNWVSSSADTYKNNNMFRWKKYEDKLNVLRSDFLKRPHDFFDMSDVSKEILKAMKNRVLNKNILELNSR